MSQTTLAGARAIAPPIWILILVSAISPLAINIFQPSLPGLMTVFGVDYATVQLTLTVYLGTYAAAQIVSGPLSDRFGRRPIILGGMALFTLGTLLCAAAPSLGVLLLGRAVQAIGGSAGLVIARAIIRDLYDRREAASMIGYVTMGFAVAPMVAPMIGGILDEAAGWRAPMIFLLAASAFVLVMAWARLSETNVDRHIVSPRVLAGEFAELGRTGLFWYFALTSALISSAFFMFLAGAPYVMIEILGRSPMEYGYYFVVVAGGYILGNFMSGRYASQVGTHPMILAGCTLQIVGLLAAALLFAAGATHPAALFGPMFFLSIANGLALPSSLAGAISVRPDLAGAASGFAGSMQIGFGAVMAPVVSGLLDDTIWPMLLLMLATSSGALVTAWAARRADPGDESP